MKQKFFSIIITALLLLGFATITPVSAHDIVGGGCYHAPGQATTCCGADKCDANGNLYNDCEMWQMGNTSGAHQYLISAWQDPHHAGNDRCRTNPTPPPPEACSETICYAQEPTCENPQTIGENNCGTSCVKDYIGSCATPTPPPAEATPTPTPTPTPYIAPTLGGLSIKAQTLSGGLAKGSFGISGLRNDDSNASKRGENYYNEIQIKQNVNITNTSLRNVAMVGIAFTNPSVSAGNTLASVRTSVDSTYTGNRPTNGFILLYVRECPDLIKYPNKCNDGSFTFSEQSFYLYFKGSWNGPYDVGEVIDKSSQGLRVVPDWARAVSSSNYQAAFSVRFLSTLDDHTWKTNAYFMNTQGNETVALKDASQGTNNENFFRDIASYFKLLLNNLL